MTWSVGANDLANIMSTTMGSKAITVKQAIIVAVIFEIAGAVIGGGSVAQTVQHGIINANAVNASPQILIYGMLAVLLASATWMTLASYLGMPVSITNAIIGSMVGFGLLVLGVHAVHWQTVGYIATSWVVSPVFAGLIAYMLFLSIQRLILVAPDPVKQAKRYVPIYLFLVGSVLSEITIIKGIEHFGIYPRLFRNIMISLACGFIILVLGMILIKRIPTHDLKDHRSKFAYIEKMFGVLMLFTACAMVYSHGSNDVAVSMGPIGAIISIIYSGHAMHNGGVILLILSVGAAAVVVGFLTYGRKIIKTVGSGITALTPSRAYCATLAAAITVVISTSTGIPVSATQTLVGGILGVGLARGIGAIDLRVVRNILASWILTIPIAAGLTVLFFDLIKIIFA